MRERDARLRRVMSSVSLRRNALVMCALRRVEVSPYFYIADFALLAAGAALLRYSDKLHFQNGAIFMLECRDIL